MQRWLVMAFLFPLWLSSCGDEPSGPPTPLSVVSVSVDGKEMIGTGRVQNVSRTPTIVVTFSDPIDTRFLNETYIDISNNDGLIFDLSPDRTTVTVTATQPLQAFARHIFWISEHVAGTSGGTLPEQYSGFFYTAPDPAPKFPVVSDSALLTLVQKQTFKYFYDFAEPNSGMARERNTSGNLVTTGGSGFGVMALIVGMERGFITREEGLQRLDKIITFLETADRFHGAWPHWIDGTTGHVIPFSANDDGGDLVETAFMIEGLLTMRQYLDPGVPEEQSLIDRINTLWEGVEWDWYTQGGQQVLYWHWSPDKDWIMNFPIRGYNEALIIYVLAAASPTHPIDKSVYDQGWAGNGAIDNGNSYYNISLPVGESYGGPLFFTHYSFLGLDPRHLSDAYANYWTQNTHHAQINYAYCIDNPKDFVGYDSACWGLTASDNQNGYSAQSPTNDLGVITPTAALSSFPYTPDASMAALKFFYYTIGDRMWGDYGFYDAFNPTASWYATSYLAIDEGPIVDMMENYRTGLLWDLFMSGQDVRDGLTKLGFTY